MRRGLDLPKPSRNANRSFALMIKYINEHSVELLPIFGMIKLSDEAPNLMQAGVANLDQAVH
jgi:hypothetical protein